MSQKKLQIDNLKFATLLKNTANLRDLDTVTALIDTLLDNGCYEMVVDLDKKQYLQLTCENYHFVFNFDHETGKLWQMREYFAQSSEKLRELPLERYLLNRLNRAYEAFEENSKWWSDKTPFERAKVTAEMEQ